jgi:hypothetical protein
MRIGTIQAHLARRLAVNLVAYMGQPGVSKDWIDGYTQAKKDCNNFLEQHKIYEPYEEEDAISG